MATSDIGYVPTILSDSLELFLGSPATGAAVAGSHTLSSVSFTRLKGQPVATTFTPEDVGCPIAIIGGGPVNPLMPAPWFVQGSTFVTEIATYVSPTEVTLVDAPVTSIFNTGFCTIIVYRRCLMQLDQIQFQSSIAPGTSDTLEFKVLKAANPYIDRFTTIAMGQPVYLRSSDPDVGDIFGGEVDTVAVENMVGAPGIFSWECHCASWRSIANRRVVPPALPGTFDDNGDVVFAKLVLTYLNDEGVSVDATAAANIKIGAPVGAHINQLLDQVVQQLSTETSQWYWDVDVWRKFILRPRTATPAPWDVDDGRDLLAGRQPLQLRATTTHDQLATFVYAIGNQTLLNALDVTLVGDGSSRTFDLPRPVGAVPTITLNGNPQTVGIFGVDAGKDWYWNQGSTTLTQSDSATILAETDALLVHYKSIWPAVAQFPNPLLSQRSNEEATSGLYDHSIQVSKPVTPEELLTIAETYALQYGKPAQTVAASTLRPGLKTGQLQHITLPQIGIDDDFLIATVRMSTTEKVIQWDYTAFSGANVGNAITGLVQFINRGQATLDLLTPTQAITSPSSASSPQQITFHHTQVAGTQTNFPILFTGVYDGTGGIPDLRSVANGGQVNNVNGYDILFSSDPGATDILDFEIDYYDPVTGNLAFWVKVPTLSASADTKIYLSWGDASITTSQENIPGCWANGFVAVYHFGTHGGNDSLAAHNLTTANRNFTAAGQIEDGMGSSTLGQADASASAALEPNALTVTCWVKPDATMGSSGDYLAVCDITDISTGANTGTYGYTLMIGSTEGTPGKLAVYLLNPDTAYNGSGSYTLSANVWAHVGFSFANPGNLHGYVNGALDKSVLSAGAYAKNTSVPLTLSRAVHVAGQRTFHGTMDEFRLANVERSAGWIQTEYNNQNSPSSFYTVGAPEYVVPPPVPVFGNPQGTVTHAIGALTLNRPVFGNGAGDVKVGTKTGTTNEVVSATGAATEGAPLIYDSTGNAESGDPGQLVPAGGTAGQSLLKLSSADYETGWGDPAPPTHSEPLTDGDSNFIFAGGDVIVAVGIPN